MMKKIIFVIFLLPLAFQAQMTFTGGPTNTSGQCQALWASNDSALMGFNDGLYRTTNGGLNWEHLTNGITADVDPRTIEYSNGKLIVGTNNGSRIYQSDDFGDSFTGGTGSVSSIAVPTASSSGPNNSMIGGTLFQPYVFDFNTNDWVSSGGTGFITTHGLKYMGGDTLWINRGSTTSYSHDNGISWTDVVTEPQTDVGGGLILTAIAQDFEKVGNRILIGTNFTGFPVLYTDDYGTSWQASDLPSTTWSDYGKRFIRINDNHILTVNVSGVWKSTDQGTTWSLVQPIAKIRTMVIFNGDHLLVGTDDGVYEFANYGEGTLVQKHGTVSSSSNLVTLPNGNILSANASGLHQYNVGNWSIFQDTINTGQQLGAKSIAIVGDSIYAFNENAYYKSGDNGDTFIQGDEAPFSFQELTSIAELDGKKFVGSAKVVAFQTPKIFYSTDNGSTYTEATFNNSISFGYGGLGGNSIERFLETPGALIADMNAGFAISTDGGITWTFNGGVWDISFIAVHGSDIYHYRNTAVPFPERVIEVSTDNGATWTDVPQTGLPNSGGSNYQGYWGAWNLDGDICTYNSYEDPRGIYKLNTGTNQWEIIPNSASSIENWDGITDMFSFESIYYANWHLNGTWEVGGGNVGIDDLEHKSMVHAFPNPVFDQLYLNSKQEIKSVTIFDQAGRVVRKLKSDSITSIHLDDLTPGIYIVKFLTEKYSGTFKITKL